VHDFADRTLGDYAKAIPYGVYDVATVTAQAAASGNARAAPLAVRQLKREM
jgi:hypothetical protein